MPAQFPPYALPSTRHVCNQPVNISQSGIHGMRAFSARPAERCMQFVWCALHMWHNMQRDRSLDPTQSATGGVPTPARGHTLSGRKRGRHKFVIYVIFFIGLVGQQCWLKRLFKKKTTKKQRGFKHGRRQGWLSRCCSQGWKRMALGCVWECVLCCLFPQKSLPSELFQSPGTAAWNYSGTTGLRQIHGESLHQGCDAALYHHISSFIQWCESVWMKQFTWGNFMRQNLRNKILRRPRSQAMRWKGKKGKILKRKKEKHKQWAFPGSCWQENKPEWKSGASL